MTNPAGAPTDHHWKQTDLHIADDGTIYVCTGEGDPGDWVQVGGGGGSTSMRTVTWAFDHTTSRPAPVTFDHLQPGEYVLDAAIFVTTAFDGSGAPEILVGLGADPYNNEFMNTSLATADTSNADGSETAVMITSPPKYRLNPGNTAIDIGAVIDDGSNGDPGSTIGAGIVVIHIGATA
jgi:hypothetical protein